MALTDYDTPGTSAWWFLHLGQALKDRHPTLETWQKYYIGDHPMPRPPKEQSKVYEQFAKECITNFMPVPVRASANRLTAIGITDANGEPDDVAWRWWQLNRMDSRQKGAYRTSLSQGVSYGMVGKHPTADPEPGQKARPLISIEHPCEVYVAVDPATGERIGSVKIRFDSMKKRWRGTMMLSGDDGVVLHRFTTKDGSGSAKNFPAISAEVWSRDGDPETTIFDRIPVVPLEFIPEPGAAPVAIFDGVIPVQNRINEGVLGRRTAERYAAWPQKTVTGHKFKMISDPLTGRRVPEQMFIPGPDQVWVSEGSDTRFGQLPAADLSGYLKVHESDIRDLLVLTSTPAYYVASQLVNLAADTVMALDTLHIALIRELQTGYGEAWEDVLGLCAQVAGVERDYISAEMRWADPRSLNPAVLADYAVKLKGAGWPVSVIAEEIGQSPQRIARIQSEAAGDALIAAAFAPNTPAATTPTTDAEVTGGLG